MRNVDALPSQEKLPTKERIVRAGVMLFQAHGYHGTGLTMLLGQAKIPKGSFYHHFPGGKEELAAATLTWLQSEVEIHLEKLADEGASFRMMMLGIAGFSAAGLRDNRSRRGSLLAVLTQDAIPESAMIAAAARRYADSIAGHLMAALERDGIDGNPAALVQQALALLQGGPVLARIAGDPNRVVEIVQSWLDHIQPPKDKE